jgi:hypothetical protein
VDNTSAELVPHCGFGPRVRSMQRILPFPLCPLRPDVKCDASRARPRRTTHRPPAAISMAVRERSTGRCPFDAEVKRLGARYGQFRRSRAAVRRPIVSPKTRRGVASMLKRQAHTDEATTTAAIAAKKVQRT